MRGHPQEFLREPGRGRDPVDRTLETLDLVAYELEAGEIKVAIEPIRPSETSIVHTFDEAVDYIERFNHRAVQWINGDVDHMMQEEVHVGEAILKHGSRLVNLHLADTDRELTPIRQCTGSPTKRG